VIAENPNLGRHPIATTGSKVGASLRTRKPAPPPVDREGDSKSAPGEGAGSWKRQTGRERSGVPTPRENGAGPSKRRPESEFRMHDPGCGEVSEVLVKGEQDETRYRQGGEFDVRSDP
jgi:hypothetical protein